jgi:membrane protease YdiL (CAAX protease family)
VDQGPGEAQQPETRGLAPVRWGIGDFVWIYLAGLFGGLVGASIGVAITGDETHHLSATTLALNAIGTYGTWAIGLWHVSRAKGHGSVTTDFGVAVSARRLWALPAGVGLQILLGAMVYPLVHLVHDKQQQIVEDLKNATGGKLVVIVLVAGLFAPVFEETMYRGLLLRALQRRFEPGVAIALSALIFAVSHLVDFNLGTVAVLPALFALGVISGVAAVRYGDLSVSIPLHMGFNLVTLAAYAVLIR